MGEKEIRAFLSVGIRIADASYQAAWDRISAEPSDGEGPEIIDLVDAEFEGLSPMQFNATLMDMAIRGAVTLYEVYLETALYEVADLVGATIVGEKSPSWGKLREVYKEALGVDPVPADVKATIALRDLLTHRHGELRTEAHRARYGSDNDGFPDMSVRLSPEIVASHMDTLGRSVRRVDAVLYPIAWGRGVAPEIKEALVSCAPWLFVWESPSAP